MLTSWASCIRFLSCLSAVQNFWEKWSTHFVNSNFYHMKRSFTLLLFCHLLCVMGFAQVKSSYLYNTSMPYGVLDIRTRISSTNYYYLQEGKTFSYRESSPGVRTNTYNDMTTWESSPYGQGNLRQKNGTSDKFIMNYRLLI